VEKSFGDWKRGTYHADIPVEPKQQGPREAHVDWPSPTLPLLTIAYKGPAYSDTTKDTAALDAFATLVFGQNSELYQKLVVREQKLDSLSANSPSSVDPDLFSIRARLKHVEDLPAIREEILAAVKRFQDELVPADKLEAVKKRERYGFTMRLDNSESVAQTVAEYVALRRTPDTIDKLYAQYGSLTPEDLREMARKYLIESGRTIVSLTGAAPAGAAK
jgi:zinc protease